MGQSTEELTSQIEDTRARMASNLDPSVAVIVVLPTPPFSDSTAIR